MISSGDTLMPAKSADALSRVTNSIVRVASTSTNRLTCGALNALDTMAVAIALRTPLTGMRSSRSVRPVRRLEVAEHAHLRRLPDHVLAGDLAERARWGSPRPGRRRGPWRACAPAASRAPRIRRRPRSGTGVLCDAAPRRGREPPGCRSRPAPRPDPSAAAASRSAEMLPAVSATVVARAGGIGASAAGAPPSTAATGSGGLHGDDRGADRHRLPLGHQDGRDHSGERRRQLDERLGRLDLDEHLVDGRRVSPTVTRQDTISASVRPSPTSGSGTLRCVMCGSFGRSESQRAVDGLENAVDVGEVDVLELGRREGRVERRHAQYRRLQRVERLLGDGRSDLGRRR